MSEHNAFQIQSCRIKERYSRWSCTQKRRSNQSTASPFRWSCNTLLRFGAYLNTSSGCHGAAGGGGGGRRVGPRPAGDRSKDEMMEECVWSCVVLCSARVGSARAPVWSAQLWLTNQCAHKHSLVPEWCTLWLLKLFMPNLCLHHDVDTTSSPVNCQSSIWSCGHQLARAWEEERVGVGWGGPNCNKM